MVIRAWLRSASKPGAQNLNREIQHDLFQNSPESTIAS